MTDAARVSVPSQDANLLDKALRAVAPRQYAKRVRYRAYGDMLAGGYDGGGSSRRSMKGWDVGAGSADADTLGQLTTLRARSRDMRRNNPYAASAINQNVTSVVGGGIKVKPQIDREVLGLGEEEAEAWERRWQMVFRAWARSEACDITRTDDFYGLQALALRAWAESGDVLAIRRMDMNRDDVLALKVQLVEADRVSNPRHRLDTEKIAGGVETDANGAPVAYHVQNTHPGDRFRGMMGAASQWTRVPAYGEKSGERQSFLLYERKRPGQSRGVPLLAPVIEPLKQLDRYTEAELDATVISALFTVFVKLEDEYPDAGELGLPSEPTGEEDADAGDIALGKGSIIDLAPGEDIEIADPTRPNQEFGPFTDHVLRQVGSALGIPFEVLRMHYGESYSAARAALQQAWQAWLTRRTWFVNRFCQRIYNWALAEAVARGMVDAPGFFEDPLVRQAWSRAEWTGPAKVVIREDRQVEAARVRVQEGFSTREQEASALTGSDYEQNVRQLGREERLRREAGIGAESGPGVSDRALENTNPEDDQ